MDGYEYDDTIPLGYLNNENPYAYCTDYHNNSINIQERKNRLAALQRIQPAKISFGMPLRHVEREKEHLLTYIIATEKKMLIKKGLEILGIQYHDFPEHLFEQNIDNEEILEIAVRIKKLNLFHQQKLLRFKVASALFKSIGNTVDFAALQQSRLEIDNLKDALIYCKLEDIYNDQSNKLF